MSLEILSIKGHGNANNEYVMLKATADINLFDYAIVDTTFNENGKVSNIMRHYFRFPKLAVKKGERIALNTGKGSYFEGVSNQDNVLHHIYWNSNAAIWNDSDPEVAEVLRVNTVEKKKSA